MNIFKTMKDRTGNIIVSIALLLGVTLPGFISTYVSAAQVTTRSISLSSSSAAASNVTYSVAFTTPNAAGAIGILFCDGSSGTLPGTDCVTPVGFSAASAATASSGYTIDTKAANSVTLSSTITSNENVSFDLTGITNPTAAGPIYARISTYTDSTASNADINTATGTSQGTAGIDNGGIAISITNSIGVSGAVLESLVFCVSGSDITDATCATTTSPVLKLGETVGSTVALVPGTISTGSLYTLLSTNAASGAVVNLKSSTIGCGGLVRVGAANCDIAPAGISTGVTTANAAFGVKAEGQTAIGSTPGGSLVANANYDNTHYRLNWVTGDLTGVTSPFGDPFLNTAGVPANGQKVKLTFGVDVTNATPAGLYSADLGLIATGKF